jgi:hypothetical protein
MVSPGGCRAYTSRRVDRPAIAGLVVARLVRWPLTTLRGISVGCRVRSPPPRDLLVHKFIGADNTVGHNKIARVPGRNPMSGHYVNP